MEENTQVDYFSPESGAGEEAANFRAPQHSEILGGNGKSPESQAENPIQQINNAQHENRQRVGMSMREYFQRHPVVAGAGVFMGTLGLRALLDVSGVHALDGGPTEAITAMASTGTWMEAKFPGLTKNVGGEIKKGVQNLRQKVSRPEGSTSTGGK